MPKIIARQCKWTKKVFTDDVKYLKHLKKQRLVLVQERIANRANLVMAETFTRMRDECNSLQDIEKFIVDNWLVFGQNARNRTWERMKLEPIPKLISVKLTGRYRDEVSNTHSSPIGKPRNWGRQVDLPYGYPGFVGDLSFVLDKRCSSFGSELFEKTGINTGAGGSRHIESKEYAGYGYEVKLFLDDWPGLAREQLMVKLQEPW
jgi:hypothetical protein